MGIGSRLRQFLRGAAAARGHVAYQGLKLPPHRLRLGSMPQRSDDTYVNYAVTSVKVLEQYAGASSRDRIVDIGSGPGRLLLGMQARWGSVERYVGIDVDADAVRWARANLAEPPIIEFLHIDVESARYNPDGVKLDATGFTLPVDDAAADLVVLLSVFSHMFLAEIEIYLREIARVLVADGRVALTAFVEDDVPAEEENPAGYMSEWRGPVHCVRLNRASFEGLAERCGFEITEFVQRRMSSGQSLYVLAPKS